ncbi:MAG: ATPase, partial [Bdellovibrionaceae bacterium]|nr:ATPase [Pseudobdellovibrionaceae bacterium]
PIIFAASSNPLVIDQPEDNLDNKYIADSIHKIIKAKKDTRQMIFVTHNPNIPVLSGAEYNLFLDYKGKKSKVDAFGTIDAVKQNILTLLEGGEIAFKLRKDIYGF